MKKKKIMIVDDEEDVVTFLKALLEDNGYEVLSASNSEQALDAIKRMKPDLICLDILMPGSSGISLHKLLKEDDETRGIPALIVSGLNIKSEIARGEGGFSEIRRDEYIEKPIEPQEFLSKIKRLVG